MKPNKHYQPQAILQAAGQMNNAAASLVMRAIAASFGGVANAGAIRIAERKSAAWPTETR